MSRADRSRYLESLDGNAVTSDILVDTVIFSGTPALDALLKDSGVNVVGHRARIALTVARWAEDAAKDDDSGSSLTVLNVV